MKKENCFCPSCGDKLFEIYHKILSDEPDRLEGRALCSSCGKGCVEYELPVIVGGSGKRFRKGETNFYGICCHCGAEGIEPVRQTERIPAKDIDKEWRLRRSHEN